ESADHRNSSGKGTSDSCQDTRHGMAWPNRCARFRSTLTRSVSFEVARSYGKCAQKTVESRRNEALETVSPDLAAVQRCIFGRAFYSRFRPYAVKVYVDLLLWRATSKSVSEDGQINPRIPSLTLRVSVADSRTVN